MSDCDKCDHNIPFPTKSCKLALLNKPCKPAALFDALPVLAEKAKHKKGKKR